MSAASCLLTEDQLMCSICLDVFTDPVTLPCGHNFCNKCITQHWDSNDQCLCPNCKRLYNTRPELHVNTIISEIADQFRASSSSSKQQAAKPGEVPCDVCTGTKVKALKSCLVCLTSYCKTHLEPHRTMSGLKRHQLTEPVENLEDRVCTQHNKLLELFCQTDQTCVCVLCTYSDHKTHDVVPLKEEYEGKKEELKKTEGEIQQMIQKRQLKIEEIKQSVKLSEERAEEEIDKGVQIFTALKESVDRGQAGFTQTIKEKQKTTEKQAEGFIKELEQEISELKKRGTEVNQLSLSEDHLHLLKSFSSFNTAPPTKDWTKFRVRPPSYEGTVRRTMVQLRDMLDKQIQFFETVQQFVVNVTLDPDKLHPIPANSTNNCRCILSERGFTSGRFYFEAQVSGGSTWTLGVTSESTMKKDIKLGPSSGFWTISLKFYGQYFASGDASVRLFLKGNPVKVGVFVDYEEGLVSFYDVHSAALIYSFTGCSFTGRLHPFFSPCWNDGGNIHVPTATTTSSSNTKLYKIINNMLRNRNDTDSPADRRASSMQ